MRLSPEIVNQYHEAPHPEKYAISCKRAERFLNFIWGLDILGAENVRQDGGGIVAFQHRSYRDPWILSAATPRAARGLGKSELLTWYYFGFGKIYLANRGIFFANRHGDASHNDMRPAYQTLRNQELLAIAPEKTSKNRGRRIGKMEDGVGRLAAWAAAKGIDAPIYPVAIASDILMPRKKIPVIFGKPFTVQIEGGGLKQAAREANDELRNRLQALSDQAYDLRESY